MRLLGCGTESVLRNSLTPAARRYGVSIVDQQRVRNGDADTACSTRQNLASDGRQRLPGAGDIIDDDDMPTLVRNRGQRDLDVTVATARLAAHRCVAAGGRGGCAHPGLGFCIGPEHQHTGGAEGPANQRRGRKRDRGPGGHRILEATHAMQVRVDRYDRIEEIRKPAPDDPLADGFARRERRVLPHVGEIGCDQRQVPRAQFTRRAFNQQ